MRTTLLACASVPLALSAVADLTVKATNNLPFERKSETIELSARDVVSLNAKSLNTIRVKDQDGREILCQAVDVNFDELRTPDVVIFQSDFAANETKTFTVFVGEKHVYRLSDFRAHGRFVRERFDDFAWENDRIAHRTYGPALMTWKGEPLTSSTIDIWSKRTTRMVIDEWYMVDDYHTDHGEGADFYSAGKSAGCGADGIWAQEQFWPAANFTTSRVLANGPIRVLFELDYAEFDVDGTKVSSTRRISLDAGSNLNRIQVSYRSQGNQPITAAIGVKKAAAKEVNFKRESGWLTQWEPVARDNGMQGLALIADPAVVLQHAESKLNHNLLLKVDSNNSISYEAGFFWDKAGHFDGYQAWMDHIERRAQARTSPIQISVSERD